MDAVLGFDTSTATLSVAATVSERTVAERSRGPDEAGRPMHARAVLGAIEEVLGEAGGWDAVGRIAVGVGPGTFTGLRIGVSTARALGQARGLPVSGVSSLAALATGAEGAAPVLAVIDAKRNEVFTALYGERRSTPPMVVAESGWEPQVETPEQLAERIAGLERPPVAIGDGAMAYRDELVVAGADVPPDDDERHLVRARFVCELAAANGGEPVPAYLRRPDAVLWRERRKAAGAA